MIGETVGVLQAHDLLRRREMFFVEIARGGLHDVVLLREFLLRADVLHALLARADVSDGEAIVGAGDVGRRRLALPIDGRLENPARRDGRREGGGLADEGAAAFAGLRSAV